ncbi:MAG: PD40 domain-containing protein [Anaerolineaceae bacterium]|nr:MAG: PD40 domain-containing protein [Anaerolineaceae bacterium]
MRQAERSLIIILLLGLCFGPLTACGQEPSTLVETTDQSIDSTSASSPTSIPVANVPSGPLGGGTGFISFSSYRDGESEIYSMSIEGSDVVRLTDDDARLSQPVWSPDGKRIAFVRRRGTEYREIYMMDADGSGRVRVLTNYQSLDIEPTWSPDGSKIAFTSSRDSYYGSGDEKVTVLNIYRVDTQTLQQMQLTDTEAWDSSPSWSPDGKKIAFQSSRDGNNEIYVMAADGTGQSNLTRNAASDVSPAWSPDGNKIAFVSDRDGDEDIYIMDADGLNQVKLLDLSGEDKSPAWSPDGQYIAFHSDEDGDFEIYLVKIDGTGLVKMTDHHDFDGFPSWQPPPSGLAVGSTSTELDPTNVRLMLDFNLMDWLSANAIPLTTTESGQSLGDLTPLGELIGDAHVVNLGGLTFGTSESFTIRQRILQYLVTELSFDTLVFEISPKDAAEINHYLQTGEGNPRELLAELDDPRWNTQEMLDMLWWMRFHNRQPGNAPTISLYGFEVDTPFLPMDLVIANLMQIDLGETGRRELVYKYLGERSSQVVENVGQLLRRVGYQGKFIVWEYNYDFSGALQDDHLSNIAFHPSVGSMLSDIYEEDPFTIGFAFGRGRMTAFDSLLEDRTLMSVQVSPAPSGSFEWFARSTALSVFVIPIRQIIDEETPSTLWLDQPLLSRLSVGVSQTGDPNQGFHRIRLARVYDALVYVDQVTPIQLLTPPPEVGTESVEPPCSATGICTQ